MALIGEDTEAWETVPCPSSQVIGAGAGFRAQATTGPQNLLRREKILIPTVQNTPETSKPHSLPGAASGLARKLTTGPW